VTISKHLQIRGAIAAVLTSGIPSGVAQVHENREFALATGVVRQIHVNFRGAQPLVGADGVVYTGHPRDWRTEIEVAVLARKDAGLEACDVADALWCEIYALVMSDQSLGGRVSSLEPGDIALDWAEGETSACRLTCSLFAQHRTDHHSIT
jgi:hypothetical protein